MGTNHRSERRRRAETRLSLVAAGLLLTNSGADVAAQPAPDAEPAAALPTATSTTVVGDPVGAYPTVSGDGRFVAFHGAHRWQGFERRGSALIAWNLGDGHRPGRPGPILTVTLTRAGVAAAPTEHIRSIE